MGWRADLVLLEADTVMTPCHNALSNVLYAAGGGAVALTMVDGRVVYRGGQFPTLDIERARYEVGRRAAKLAAG